MSKYAFAGSILSADLLNLGHDVAAALDCGVEVIHFDVMDFHFVPNLTFGPDCLKAMRRRFPEAILDVHLMVTPVTEEIITAYAKAGASWISFHPEATAHIDRTLALIQSFGIKAGLVLNPGTPPQMLRYLWDHLDFVLAMTVNPGFGGQKLIDACLTKVADIKAMAREAGREIPIEVDGGVSTATVARCAKAGAEIFVVGSAFFGKEDKAKALADLRTALKEGLDA